jgi:hypothetical protein
MVLGPPSPRKKMANNGLGVLAIGAAVIAGIAFFARRKPASDPAPAEPAEPIMLTAPSTPTEPPQSGWTNTEPATDVGRAPVVDAGARYRDRHRGRRGGCPAGRAYVPEVPWDLDGDLELLRPDK